MNPPAPPTTDSLRQRIFDSLIEGLETILVANNYATNVGQRVFPWQDHPLAEAQLPGIIVRDVGTEPVSGSSGICTQHRLHFEVALIPAPGEDATTDCRTLWGDILTFLKYNRRLTSGADVLTVTSEYVGDEMRIDQKSQKFAGMYVRFFTLFKMTNLDPYTPSP